MKEYIPSSKLKNLAKYKYSGVDLSLACKYFLQPYWNWLVQKFPLSMAPNLITLIGFLCICANLVTLLWLSPNLQTPVPGWAYLSFAVGLWIYQSLDAIDGKQARRTGTSSPLGQLFDHGCDAMNTTFGSLIGASALNLGQTWLAVLSLVVTSANFYLSTWEEYHTGVLYLGYINGPDEGVLMLIGIYLLSAYFGAGWWSQNIRNVLGYSWLPSWQINETFIYACLGLMVFILTSCFYNVAVSCKAQKKSIIGAFSGVLPFIFYNGMLVVWLYYSPIIMRNYFVPVTLAVGFGFGNMVGRMIVAHVIHDDFPFFNIAFIPMTLGAVGAYSGLLTVQQQIWVVYGGLALNAMVHSHFVFYVINRICAYLDINCLTIKHSASNAVAGKVAKSSSGTPPQSSSRPGTPLRSSTRKAAAVAAAIIAETPQRPYGRRGRK